MAGMCVSLAVFVLVLGFCEAYYPLVYGKPGSCRTKIKDVIIKLQHPSGQGSACTDIGDEIGTLDFGEFIEFDCLVDLCLVKETQRTASGDVWGLTHRNSSETMDSNDKRALWTLPMERDLCESLSGRYHVFGAEQVRCAFDLVRQPGGTKDQMKDIMFIAGRGDCPAMTTAAGSVGLFWMNSRFRESTCQALQGELRRHVCAMDLCFQDSHKCTPSDMYVIQETCRNIADDDATNVTCTYELTTGLSTIDSNSLTTGGSTSVQVDASIGAELLSIFSLSMTASVAREFSWSRTTEVASTISETTKKTLEMVVRPGYHYSIEQLVGVCGPYHIQTNDYTIEEVEIDTPTC